MANLQVKNVPSVLHERLRAEAERRRQTLGDFVLHTLERELEKVEFSRRLLSRPKSQLNAAASAVLAEERRKRERELAG